MNQETSTQNIYDWIVYPDAYLASALHLCNQMPSGIHDEHVVTSDFFSRVDFRSHHGSYFAIYPIVFNLKHGIELYLKGFSCMVDNRYVSRQNGHDLKYLFNFVVNKATKATDEQKKVLQELYQATWPIISKYYYGTYCSNVRTENNPDCKNESERYPETKIAYTVNEPDTWVTYGVIQKIKEDILFLEQEFSQTKINLTL